MKTELIPMTLEEQKKTAYEILCAVHDYCVAHQIRYYLAYGTLIGAIRHKGYIPWDDDIDIWMPRKDYDRFISDFNSDNTRLRVVAPGDGDAKHTIAKVIDTETVKIEQGIAYHDDYLGVDIDVIPLDGVPSDRRAFEKLWKKNHRLQAAYFAFVLDSKQMGIKWKQLIPMYRLLFDRRKLLEKIEKNARYADFDQSEKVGVLSFYFCEVTDYYDNEFDPPVQVQFEDRMFFAPRGYDKILRAVYGDYMLLPPEEERVTHHLNQCYKKQKAGTE